MVIRAFRTGMVIAALAGALALTGCDSGGGDDSGSDWPDYRGTITQSSGTSIRIEEIPSQQWQGAKAVLQVPDTTSIAWSTGAAARRADLTVGRQVQAWVDGVVAESYPVQGTASRIVIVVPGN